jgi:hypothetical protein
MCNLCTWPECELIAQLRFPSKTIRWILIKFLMTITSQYSISLPQLKSKNFQSLSLNPAYWGLFNITKRVPKFHYNFGVLIWMNFQWKNCSIFHNFSAVSPNIMKPNLCNPSHAGLSNGTKRHKKPHDLGEVISTWKTKQK